MFNADMIIKELTSKEIKVKTMFGDRLVTFGNKLSALKFDYSNKNYIYVPNNDLDNAKHNVSLDIINKILNKVVKTYFNCEETLKDYDYFNVIKENYGSEYSMYNVDIMEYIRNILKLIELEDIGIIYENNTIIIYENKEIAQWIYDNGNDLILWSLVSGNLMINSNSNNKVINLNHFNLYEAIKKYIKTVKGFNEKANILETSYNENIKYFTKLINEKDFIVVAGSGVIYSESVYETMIRICNYKQHVEMKSIFNLDIMIKFCYNIEEITNAFKNDCINDICKDRKGYNLFEICKDNNISELQLIKRLNSNIEFEQALELGIHDRDCLGLYNYSKSGDIITDLVEKLIMTMEENKNE